MQRKISLPHLVLAVGLVLLAVWLGVTVGNALGSAYALIAALIVTTRGLERPTEPTPVRVEVEP
ncbi:MAG TPA: hypothetical protein PKA98_08395 [Acidimicrobiales bacterium]|nr:hypothetical protein [Acidimicrobiales bacterium]